MIIKHLKQIEPSKKTIKRIWKKIIKKIYDNLDKQS